MHGKIKKTTTSNERMSSADIACLAEIRPSIAHVLVRRQDLSVVVHVRKETTVGGLKRWIALLLNYKHFPSLQASDIHLRYPEDVPLDDDGDLLDDLGLFKKDMPTVYMMFSQQEQLQTSEPLAKEPNEQLLVNAMHRARESRQRLGFLNPE